MMRPRSPTPVAREVGLDGRTLTPEGVVAVARGDATARLEPAAVERNASAQRFVEHLVERGGLLYGVSTGVGMLRTSPVEAADRPERQLRLLRSHAGGAGAPLGIVPTRQR